MLKAESCKMVTLEMAAVNRKEFMDAVKADPQTYADWFGSGEWRARRA